MPLYERKWFPGRAGKPKSPVPPRRGYHGKDKKGGSCSQSPCLPWPRPGRPTRPGDAERLLLHADASESTAGPGRDADAGRKPWRRRRGGGGHGLGVRRDREVAELFPHSPSAAARVGGRCCCPTPAARSCPGWSRRRGRSRCWSLAGGGGRGRAGGGKGGPAWGRRGRWRRPGRGCLLRPPSPRGLGSESRSSWDPR